MKKGKRLVIGALILAMVLSCFAGCGSNKSSENSESDMSTFLCGTWSKDRDNSNYEAKYNNDLFNAICCYSDPIEFYSDGTMSTGLTWNIVNDNLLKIVDGDDIYTFELELIDDSHFKIVDRGDDSYYATYEKKDNESIDEENEVEEKEETNIGEDAVNS